MLVYSFGNGKADGSKDHRELLGGKGANLAEMTLLGLPVPPGFTITTEVCTYFYSNQSQYPAALEKSVLEALSRVEKTVGCQWGSSDNPLLVSVRSGSRASMPGMMDTILNLGLNDSTLQGLIKQSKDERFAYDAYRRFLQMYSDVVLNVYPHHFETLLDEAKRRAGVDSDNKLPVAELKKLVSDYKQVV
mgnify:FL=1